MYQRNELMQRHGSHLAPLRSATPHAGFYFCPDTLVMSNHQESAPWRCCYEVTG